MDDEKALITIPSSATVPVHKIKGLNAVIPGDTILRREATPLIAAKASIDSKKELRHVDFNDAQADCDDVIKVQRSFHGIQSGLLAGNDDDNTSGHIDFRDPSGLQRTPKSEDGTCHVVLTCLADIFSLKHYYK